MARPKRKNIKRRLDSRIALPLLILAGLFLFVVLQSPRETQFDTGTKNYVYKYPSEITVTDQGKDFKKLKYLINGIGFSFVYPKEWKLDFIDAGYGTKDTFLQTKLPNDVQIHIGYKKFMTEATNPFQKTIYLSSYGTKSPKIFRHESLTVDGHHSSLIEGEFYYEYLSNYDFFLFLDTKKARRVQRDEWLVEPAEFEVRFHSKSYSQEKEDLYKEYSNQIISTLDIID